MTATDTNSASVSDTFDIEVAAAGSTPTGSALVSNLGNTQSDFPALTNYDLAQPFDTGSNAAGYTLTGIDLRLRGGSCGPTIDVPSVRVVAEDPMSTTGQIVLSTSVAALTCVTDETVAYTAPGGSTLAASTEYFVVVENGSSGGAIWWQTSNNSETGEAGWSIADKFKRRSASSTGSFSIVTGGIQMLRINGTANRSGPNRSPRVANRIPDQSPEIGSFFSYVIPADTFTDADGDELRYEAQRGKLYYDDGRVFNTVALDYYDGYTRDGHPWLEFDAENAHAQRARPAGGQQDRHPHLRPRRAGAGGAETDFFLNPTVAPMLVSNLSRAWSMKPAPRLVRPGAEVHHREPQHRLHRDQRRPGARGREVRRALAGGEDSKRLGRRLDRRAAHARPASGAVAGTKLYRYTAPANTVLAASTDYWVSIEGDERDVGVLVWNLRSNRADAGSAAGWSLAEDAERRNNQRRRLPRPPI